jgi:long-chain acyl-CoA synthetase
MAAKCKYEERPWLKLYLEGVPADARIPDMSLPQVLDEAMEKWGDRTAFIFYGARISYRQLKEQIDRFATALCGLGVQKGDRVALLLLNSPQFAIAYFGALRAGATLTPISPVYVSPEIKHQIEDSGAKTIVCQDILYDHVERAGVKLERVILTNITEYLPRLRKLLGKGILRGVYQRTSAPSSDFFDREGFYHFQDLIKRYPPNPPQIEFNPKEDLATLPYTGGTTGSPKGAMLTHYNLIAGESLIRASFAPVLEDGKEVVIAYLPFYHIYGQVVVMLSEILRGSSLVIFATPEPDHILNAIGSCRATIFYGVPALYEALRDYVKTERVNWKRLKSLVSGADALLQDTAIGWEKRTGVKIHEGYGMTETSSVATISPYGRPNIGSFGIPLPSTMAAVAHADSNEFLPVGEVGELLLRGPQIMGGYWNRPEETKSVLVQIDGEIWLRTSDLVRMNEDGYFYFYDRKRDMIKYKGYAVFAREVEEVLTSHPQIKEAGVIGVPDPKVGENLKAVVVLQTEARGKLSEEEVMEYCRENLAHYKVPKIIEFRGEVPKTDVGKVSRRELREEDEV